MPPKRSSSAWPYSWRMMSQMAVFRPSTPPATRPPPSKKLKLRSNGSKNAFPATWAGSFSFGLGSS
jgi:hypothetical protein